MVLVDNYLSQLLCICTWINSDAESRSLGVVNVSADVNTGLFFKGLHEHSNHLLLTSFLFIICIRTNIPIKTVC